MKNKILIGFVVFLIVGVIGFNVNMNIKSSNNSGLTFSKLQFLAFGEDTCEIDDEQDDDDSAWGEEGGGEEATGSEPKKKLCIGKSKTARIESGTCPPNSYNRTYRIVRVPYSCKKKKDGNEASCWQGCRVSGYGCAGDIDETWPTTRQCG